MTDAALLQALAEARAVPVSEGEGMTTAELVAVSGTPEKRLRATLRAMVAAGTVRVSRRTIRTLDGRATPVSSYLLVGR